MPIDVLIVNAIGPGWSLSTAQKGLGGSELEITLVAHALKRRGHTVVVANGIDHESLEDGVKYVPLGSIQAGMEARALWIERMTAPPNGVRTKRIVIRATDINCAPYDVHKPMLESGQAAVVVNTKWQADGFAHAKEKIIIPPALDYSLGDAPLLRIKGQFVFASAPMKGLGATVEQWRALKKKHGKVLKKAKLILALPGLSDFYGDVPIPLTEEDKAMGISYAPSPSLVEYRRLIASSEGMFYVNRMAETFCSAAAFAEKYGTRTHILCLNGRAGIPEALVNSSLVVEDPVVFERLFMEAWQAASTPTREPTDPKLIPDYSPDALVAEWEKALGLRGGEPLRIRHETAPERAGGFPPRAGTHLGHYENTLTGGTAQRYWVHDRILVGGSILHAADVSLLRNLGITHVVSAEDDRGDEGKWADDKRARFGFPDDGLDIDEGLLHKATDHLEAILKDPLAVLYVHCRMGGSRGPSLAYLALRATMGASPHEAMRLIRQTRGPWTPHLRYIDSIERALTTRSGHKLDLSLAQENVVEAYRATTTPQTRAALSRLRPGDTPLFSEESLFPQEDLPENKTPFGPEHAHRVSLMKAALCNGGSEMGLGLVLLSLVAATRATRVIEIGRFRGFATLALASGLALAEAGWSEPSIKPRPDVDYKALLDTKKRRVCYSIDPFPTPEADALIETAGLSRYVEKIDKRSDDVDPSAIGPADVLFIDGDHSLGQIRRDIARFVPHVRPGGYFVLHDYYGWYTPTGENGSPIKKAIDEDLAGFERILIDTGFVSFVVFRKMCELEPRPDRVPARADGRPTVGLVIIAVGNEVATVLARAIVSAWKMVDAVTVVVDGSEQAAEVARHVGADVYIKPTPKIDWEKGVGAIAGARNEALAIAERKTDYVVVLDADDTLEGEFPRALVHDVYELDIHDANVVYRRVQMWKSDKGFRYTGIIHETLSCAGSVGRIPSIKYQRRFGGGHQDAVPAEIKYMRHVKLVSKWLIDHPDDTRSQFYLAQSYRDARKPDDAIREYEKRIAMTGGNEEEIAFSALQIARILKETGKDPTTAFIRAYELRPTRAEPLFELANWLRMEDRKRFALGAMVAKTASLIPRPTNDALFIDPSVYEWRALDEYAIASYWVGDRKASKEAYEQLRTRVPDGMRKHVEDSIIMCKRALGEPI